MTVSVLNGAPKAILKGIRDAGGGTLPVVAEMLPQSLPHLFLFTSEGVTEPQLVVGDSAKTMFGSDVFELRTKYTTHQTVMASVFNKNANAMMIQRLRPADANPEATLTVSLEIVPETIPTYNRNADGTYALDANGAKVPDGNTIAGHMARFVIGSADSTAGNVFGERAVKAGALTNAANTQAQVYPLFDIKVSSFGAHGNLKGMRLWAPTQRTTGGTDTDTIDLNNAFMYRLQFVKRADDKSTAKVVPTLNNAQYVDFALKSGAVNSAVGTEVDIEEVVLPMYQDMNSSPKRYGPFGEIHVYRDNIKTVSDMIYATEQPHQLDWPADADEGRYLVNLVGGENVYGVPYHTLQLLGKAGGGVDLTSNATHYAAGGSDGTMDFATHDTLVKEIVSDYPFKDMAYYPQSSLWDSGFSMETTKAMFAVMGKRKDMYVVAATQDVSLAQNNTVVDASAAMALQAAARAFPESEIYGTGACRAIIVGQSGKLINSEYKGLLPLTVDFADKVSAYMGASNGIWKKDRGFDISPYNQVTMFDVSTVNNTYKDPEEYASDWDNGMVWAQTFDRSKLFYPAFQNVYADSTSPLNSAINMMGMVESEKVCHRSWARLTGRADLTPEQFLEKSDELLTELMDPKRFDGRFIVSVRTYFTDIDAALGYAWSVDITVYQPNMYTVGSFTVTSDRYANFAAA